MEPACGYVRPDRACGDFGAAGGGGAVAELPADGGDVVCDVGAVCDVRGGDGECAGAKVGFCGAGFTVWGGAEQVSIGGFGVAESPGGGGGRVDGGGGGGDVEAVF